MIRPDRTGRTRTVTGLWWKVISRNKKCVTLNLGTPEGQQILRALVLDADVLVENFRPGVLEKWGLGPERLHALNPGLIMLRVTGFGQAGPYARRRAFGTLAEAMSGFAHQTGHEDGPPTLPPFGLADGVAGITGAFAIMTALYHRATPEGNGQGQVIDLSLLEPLLGILGPGPTAFDQLGAVPGRHGNRSPNNAPRNAYLTKDGRWVAISASATSVAERVMRLVGRPDIVEEPWFGSAGERSRNGELLDEAVAKWIASRSLSEVTQEFERVGAALAPIYDIEQLMNDPHVVARETITTVDDEDLGPVKMQNLPDHVHLLVRVEPTDAPAQVVRVVKGRTAWVLGQEFPHLRDHAQVWWSPSYLAASVGYVSGSTVRRDIEHQWDAVMAS